MVGRTAPRGNRMQPPRYGVVTNLLGAGLQLERASVPVGVKQAPSLLGEATKQHHRRQWYCAGLANRIGSPQPDISNLYQRRIHAWETTHSETRPEDDGLAAGLGLGLLPKPLTGPDRTGQAGMIPWRGVLRSGLPDVCPTASPGKHQESLLNPVIVGTLHVNGGQSTRPEDCSGRFREAIGGAIFPGPYIRRPEWFGSAGDRPHHRACGAGG